MLRTSDLDYDLPTSLIATSPAQPRDAARLLVVSRSDPSRLEHLHIRDLPGLLSPGDLMVFNTTRVLPARLLGRRRDTGGRAEGLYLHDGPEPWTWVMLVQAKRARAGVVLDFEAAGGAPGVSVELLEPAPDEPGAWVGRVTAQGEDSASVLERVGVPPLPPYIRRARREGGGPEDVEPDRGDYQTVYAHAPGSVAAPTAGLHFTPELLGALRARGVERGDVTLHVGVGTFKPVETEYVEQHPIHPEWCSMPGATREAILARRAWSPKAATTPPPVICVGTTATRTVETYAALGDVPPSVTTRLLITPGYQWRWTDGLLTNFHLPRSTLMAMVGSLLPGGIDRLKVVYAEAIRNGYRFYSYGDAMLVLP